MFLKIFNLYNDLKEYVVNEEALEYIQSVPGPIGVVGVNKI